VLRVAPQVVGAEAGKAPDQVELRQRRPVAAIDASVGVGQAVAGQRPGGGVELSLRPLVAAGAFGGVGDERQGGDVEEQAGGRSAAQVDARGGGQPGVNRDPGVGLGEGAFDVQQGNPGGAVGQRLRPWPVRADVGGERGGGDQIVGDAAGQVQHRRVRVSHRGTSVRVFWLRATARARR